MVWKPHGILDQALVNEIVAFVEAAEERAQKPFNRFADLSALDAVDLNFRFVFHTALHRRLAFESHPPVKTYFWPPQAEGVVLRQDLVPERDRVGEVGLSFRLANRAMPSIMQP